MPRITGNYRLAPAYKFTPVVGNIFTLPKLFNWSPSLVLWGGSALVTVLYLADSIPIYRQAILQKLPAIGSYYDDTIDPEDTPF